MVEGHVSFRACGFESRSGHKHKSRKAAITAAFLVFQRRSGPVVGPLLQKLQKIGIVLLHANRVQRLLRLRSQPQLLQHCEPPLPGLLQALVRWMLAHHGIAFSAHGGVGDAFGIDGTFRSSNSCLRLEARSRSSPNPTVLMPAAVQSPTICWRYCSRVFMP